MSNNRVTDFLSKLRIIPNLTDATADPDGVRLVSVFSLMIEAWLSKEFAPEAMRAEPGTGFSGETIGC